MLSNLKIKGRQASFFCGNCLTSGVVVMFSKRNQRGIERSEKVACPYCSEWTKANEVLTPEQAEQAIKQEMGK